MKCEACEKILPEYLAGELSPDEREGVEKHLDECASCRDEVRAMDAIERAAGEMPRAEPGTAAILKISEAIHQYATPPRRTEFGPVLDIDELVDFLRIDRAVIEIYLDEIPCFELGGKLLFRRKSVEAWIERKEMQMSVQTQTMVRDLPRSAGSVRLEVRNG